LDSDAGQYALLRPLLERHRQEAIARMNAELARQPDYWKDRPLDEAWKDVDAAVVAEIEKAGGIVERRWALCQARAGGRLWAGAEARGAAGSRPLSVGPWSSGGTGGPPVAALVWTRDGREWELEPALTLAGLKERDAQRQKAGLIPADVAAYRTQDG